MGVLDATASLGAPAVAPSIASGSSPAPSSAVAATITLAATAVAVAALVVLHLLPTGLSPLRDAVSHYGITRFRLGYRVQTMAFGVAGLAAAAAVADAYHSGRRLLPVVLLALFGLARLVISWFPMDAPGAPRTSHGTAHGLLALVTFGSITAAAFALRQTLSRVDETTRSGFVDTVRIVAWLLLLAVIATGLTRRVPELRGWFGAAERLIYVGTVAVLLAIGVALI